MTERLPTVYSLYRIAWQGIDLLFPPSCGGCGKFGVRWCDECQKNLVVLQEPLCNRCGLPQSKSGVCEKCLENPPFYKELRAWLAFDGSIRKALHGIKYHKNKGMGEELAFELLPFVRKLNWQVDVAVPVPLGKERYKERGYNQVSSFAFPLALAMKWKFSPKALRRVKETRSQVDLSAIERMKNVKDAFVADRRWVDGKSVLVLDDVSTTGATLNSCADALISGGATAVYVLTVARALPQHGLRTI